MDTPASTYFEVMSAADYSSVVAVILLAVGLGAIVSALLIRRRRLAHGQPARFLRSFAISFLFIAVIFMTLALCLGIRP